MSEICPPFNKLKFDDYKIAKYSIINSSEDVEKVKELLENDSWKMINEEDQLVISVIGGAAQFSLPTEIKTRFKIEIAKLTETTRGLIITG